ncbi:hypothetical protein CC86DRAFT_432319 [Ophiobolus disseminans]|uniref:Uncharacterized protein n=1 Tax=Ophiobolus disseminans TaxID=1469910 RepID=A0A6A6ZEU5_9PLEO|nr:hypothetical protein CC86DRAFT_432319 [Ophiobolus disseminans]
MPVTTEEEHPIPERCRFLELPTELRLMIYEYCAEPTRKIKRIMLGGGPLEIECDFTLHSTSVELLSTCGLINEEASAIVRRQIARIVATPTRLIVAFEKVLAQDFFYDFLGMMNKTASRTSQILQAGHSIGIPILVCENSWEGFETVPYCLMPTRRALGRLLMHAVQPRSCLTKSEPGLEIGFTLETVYGTTWKNASEWR